ncbi:KaiC-like protein 2 [Bienertia sinuspersici]
MNDTGWKVDTGHKSGYLTYIMKEMAKKLPKCNLKADPHIKSKVKVMKKQLTYILEIQQNRSGFGWDDEQKMVIGDKEIFLGWEKIYANDLAKGGKVKGYGERKEKDSEMAINDIKRAFVHEVDVHEQKTEKRKQLFQLLSTLSDLTTLQIVKATRLIGQDTVKMELFFTMPDDFKVIFAQQEISGAN